MRALCVSERTGPQMTTHLGLMRPPRERPAPLGMCKRSMVDDGFDMPPRFEAHESRSDDANPVPSARVTENCCPD